MSKGKNKYIGKWTETGSRSIDLPYSPLNLLFLFDQASKAERGDYNHQDIANWCLQYWQKYFLDDENELDVLGKVAVELASEVDAQWELYLTNTYSLEQLKNLDFASVYLPQEWFEQWARVLKQAIY